MRIRLIAIGQKMPDWVAAGFEEYRRRLPREFSLELVELPLGGKGRHRDPQTAREEEGARMLRAVPEGSRVVALDVKGRQRDTEELAEELQGWLPEGRDVALLVGGPDGLSETCLARADQRWSLSRLTLPHMLVRVVLAEQLYRAWTIIKNHPYHR